MYAIELDHATDTGHRIPGHQNGLGKCARLHGHTYNFHVQLTADMLEEEGFVVDFGDIKTILDEWDHRMLLWADDPLGTIIGMESGDEDWIEGADQRMGIIRVEFIPTAENMARHLAQRFVSEFQQVVFALVEVRETAKSVARYYCSASELAARQLGGRLA